MTTSVRAVLGLLMCGVLTSACQLSSDAENTSTTAADSAAVTRSSPADDGASDQNERVRLVEEDRAAVVLGVSNQSFEDPDVSLVVNFDGVDLIDQSFPVEGQHTVTSFGIDAAWGPHTMTVVSDTGASASETLDLSAGDPLWVYVDYWYFDPAQEGLTAGDEETPGPALFVRVSDEPMPID